jgi:hypothetical protein
VCVSAIVFSKVIVQNKKKLSCVSSSSSKLAFDMSYAIDSYLGPFMLERYVDSADDNLIGKDKIGANGDR